MRVSLGYVSKSLGHIKYPAGAQWQQFMLLGAWGALKNNRAEAAKRHAKVATDSGYVAWPLACAEANATAAYARAVCKDAYEKQHFAHSWLKKDQDSTAWPDAFPKVDFHFWAEFGSWSQCYNCRSFFYNDDYFTHTVYGPSYLRLLGIAITARGVVPGPDHVCHPEFSCSTSTCLTG